MKNEFSNNHQGALLVNLLVSLGIITIMATVTIPYLKKFQPSLRLSGAVRELASDLRYAQQLTITEQIPYALYLDETFDNYYIYKLEPLSATTTIKIVNLPLDISFDNVSGFTSNLVRFNSYGSVDENGIIVLANTENSSSTIQVKPSGYISTQ